MKSNMASLPQLTIFYLLAFLVTAHSMCMEQPRPLTRVKLSRSLASRDRDGRTPLHNAVHIRDTLRRLVELGAPLDAQDNLGNTALHLAVIQQKQQAVEYLISQKAAVNVVNNGGLSPLCLAARLCEQNDDLVKILVDAGAQVNIQEPVTGLTPLHMVYKQKERGIPHLRDAIRALIEAGARVDIQDATGHIPNDDLFAEMSRGFIGWVKENNIKMAHKHLKQGVKCDTDSLTFAANSNWIDMVCLLLDYGATPTITSFNNAKNLATKLLMTHVPRQLIKEQWNMFYKKNGVGTLLLLGCKELNFPKDVMKIIIRLAIKNAIIDEMTARALLFCAYAQENFLNGVYGFNDPAIRQMSRSVRLEMFGLDSAYLDDKVNQYVPQWIEQINKATQTNKTKQ